jgi:hypothetical protein
VTADRIGLAGAVALCGLAALGLIPAIVRLPLMIELPNEGWNAIHAMHAFGPGLYPDPRDGIVNNYPPLWHYLTGALFVAFGDPILPGRIVSLVATGATLATTFALARALGATGTASALAASWLAATLAAGSSGRIGASEPQMLASAFIVGATAAIVRARSRGAVAAAALAMALGGGFKHNVIALPLASAAWLWRYRRPLFRVWLLVSVVAACAAAAALAAGYGANVVANLAAPRVLSLNRLATNLALASSAVVPLASFGWILARAPRPLDPALAFVAFALGGGFAEILLFGGALGVSTNIGWDLMIASAVAMAMVWDAVAARSTPAWAARLRLALVLAAIARVVIGFPLDDLTLATVGRARLADQAASLGELRDRLRAVPDPVACEHLSICAWAGHASQVDLWKLRFERTLHPIVDVEAVLAAIAHGRFSAVTLFGRHSGPQDDGNLPGLSAALAACCDAPIYLGASTLYLRRPPSPGRAAP